MKFAICFIAVLFVVCTASAIPGYKPSDEDWYAGNQDNNGDRYEEKLPNALVDEQELENMRARGRDTLYVYMHVHVVSF